MISHLFRPFASLFLKVNFANRFWTNKVSAEQVAKRLEQEGQGGTVDWGYPVMAVDGLFHGKSWIKKADDDIGYPHLRKPPFVEPVEPTVNHQPSTAVTIQQVIKLGIDLCRVTKSSAALPGHHISSCCPRSRFGKFGVADSVAFQQFHFWGS